MRLKKNEEEWVCGELKKTPTKQKQKKKIIKRKEKGNVKAVA